MRYIQGFAALALALLFLAGCDILQGNSRGPEPAESGEFLQEETPQDTALLQYDLRLSNRYTWVVDQDGNTVPEGKQFTVLYDIGTGQPQCKTLTRVEDTGERDEYGNAAPRTLTALYSMDGKLLRDWGEYSYAPGFGDYIFSRDYMGIFALEEGPLPEDAYHPCLWNVKTSEPGFTGAFSAQELGDGAFLISNIQQKLIGVLDREGNRLAGFPAPQDYYYANVWNGYILAKNKDTVYSGPEVVEQTVIMTADLRPVYSRETYNGDLSGTRGEALIYREWETEHVLTFPEGETVFSAEQGEDIRYYDGELGIIDGKKPAGDSVSESKCRLVDASGDTVADGYDYLCPVPGPDDESPAQAFIGRRGDLAEKLDRKGQTIASVELPGVTDIIPLESGYCICYDTNHDYNGLLGTDFKVIVPFGTYYYIAPASNYRADAAADYPVWQAWRKIGGNIYRYDILDSSGKPQITDLTRIFDFGPNRVAVIKGFEAGLIDWQGNWIVRQSLFTRFEDD